MKLIEIEERPIKRSNYPIRHIIEKFLESGQYTMEVVDWENTYGSVEKFYNSLWVAIKQNRRFRGSVKVSRWNGHVYLMRLQDWGD